MVYAPKMPRWVELIPSLKPCEPESFHESYSSGILPDNSTLHLLRKREVNERLCIGEVGVDLEPCVHAHGHDVYLIMEASFKKLFPCYKFILYLWTWFRPCSPLNTIFDASVSICLLWINTPVQPLL